MRGNAHPRPPMRSIPKPNVPRVIWGVLSLFLMSALCELVVLMVVLRFECSALVLKKT